MIGPIFRKEDADPKLKRRLIEKIEKSTSLRTFNTAEYIFDMNICADLFDAFLKSESINTLEEVPNIELCLEL